MDPLQIAENCQILRKRLSRWILDMHQHSLPLKISDVCHLAQLLLSARLKSTKKVTFGENWVTQFVERHPELESKYTRQYDYKSAKCKDPELIKGCFNHVQETIQRYGILEHDIYNMGETGFQIGVASTAMVFSYSKGIWY